MRDRIATAEGKRRYVRTLFATIADRYDFITIALSYGQDRRWKRRLVAAGSAGRRDSRRSISRPGPETSRSRWPHAAPGSSVWT